MHGARPTIGDVAHAAGVSKGTVSLAYSGKRPVAEETRRRIFAAAETLRWTASSSAQALATSRTSTIGLVIARRPEIIATDTFFPRFIAGCEAVLAEAGMGLMLNVVADEDAETAAYERFAAGRVDGVILLDVEQGDRRPNLVRELGLTAVMLSAEPPHENDPVGTPVVYTEDAAAVGELVELLIEAGHSRIAHVSGPLRYVHAVARRDAFAAAMTRHGLLPDRIVEGDFTAASGRDATAALLDGDDRPTAIVYANDVMAIAGLSYARSSGLRIPEDLSVTGFDDSELSAHLSPGLTSVSTGADVRGAVAARTLLAALGGDARRSVLVDGTVVVRRGSIAPPSRP
ncbi:LacI family DNA-binding transcriptional regulator [Brachybacterium fresconis]|uniref:DNA-binding LacI/PurR family transcriptional regulator n=1 Tax=Brachybacterium fresconis TaxID=173363 RepID=A0ABS4YG23_9MICO|nr:LacI family DNA-binding transcriptional regulator [Brachybacterium fresconis]MBP2407337.1 DNA-binding LacI/PurR family transcriptional regulator [Brachybacterium fresconis]